MASFRCIDTLGHDAAVRFMGVFDIKPGKVAFATPLEANVPSAPSEAALRGAC
jgi:hypothetical protein